MTAVGRRSLALILSGCVGLLATGCRQPPILPPPITLEQVVEAVNRNSGQLRWVKGRIESVGGELVDSNGKRTGLDLLGLDGLLIYAQPGHLYMDLSKTGKSVVQLGSNEQFYWMWGGWPGEPGRCWVGSYERWGPALGGGTIPIHPAQLAKLLGVDAIVSDLSAPPWPVLRVSKPSERANIVQFVAPAGERMVLLRELWVDRDSNLPKRVKLFNGQGQVIYESRLTDWRAVSGVEALFPHDVLIRTIVVKPVTGPDGKAGVVQVEGTRLRLRFAALRLAENLDPARNPRAYQFRCPGGSIIVPLDNVAATQAGTGELD